MYIYTYIVCVLDAFDIGKPFLDIRFTQSKYHIIYIYIRICVCASTISHIDTHILYRIYTASTCAMPHSLSG